MYPVSTRFAEVVTGSHLAVVRARICTQIQFSPDPVGVDVPIIRGDVKIDASAAVKASLDVTIPGDWWDELLPLGPELWVARGVDFGGGDVELVPLGYYRIQSAEQDPAPYGPIRITAQDRTAQLIQNRPVVPWQVPSGTSHRVAFERVVNGVGGGLAAYPGVTVPILWDAYNPDSYTVPEGTVVEDDAHGFLVDLVDGRGATLLFDELGQLRIVTADPDPATASPVYTVAPGRGGVLVRATRTVTRDGVYNIVTAHGSDPAAPTGYQSAYNSDPSSPLRAGGPFGPAPRFFSSPLLRDAAGALSAARTRLAGTTGLPTTLALYTVPTPAVRALDVVQATVGADSRPHVIEALTVPLTIGRDNSPLQIETRGLNVPVEITSDPDPTTTPDPSDGDPDTGTDDGSGGGVVEGIPANPGEALWIGPTPGKNHFDIGIGTDAMRDTSPTNIAGGFTSPNFKLSDDKQWVDFMVRADAATTGGSQYPRSELRETQEGSDSKIFWDASSGDTSLETTWKVDEAGNGSKPYVNVQQIHDRDDDVLRIMVKGTNLSSLKVVGILRDVETTLISSYTLGQVVTSRIEVDQNGALRVVVDGVVKLQAPAGTIKTGNYYKAGCYINFNTKTGDSASSLGRASIKRGSLHVVHAGYAQPTQPPWKTSGSSPGGGTGGTGTSVPVGSVTKFAESFEIGNFSRWNSVQNHAVDSADAASYDLATTYSQKIVNGGTNHSTALRTEVRDGDTAVGSHERAELSGFGKTGMLANENDELWYEFDVKFDTLPTFSGSNDWLIFFQWHQVTDPGAPPLALSMHNDGKVYLEREPDDTPAPDTLIWTPTAGTWHRVVAHIKWSPSPSVGFVQIHVDGVEKMPKTFVQTQYTSDKSNYYPKLGTYRRSTVSGTSVVLHDNVRISGPPATTSSGGGGTGTTSDGTQAAVLLGWGTLVAGDEFDYSGSPSSSKWSMYDGPGHADRGYRRPSAFTVADGMCTLTGTSGVPTSGGMAYRRDERYCRIEVRARMFATDTSATGNMYNGLFLQWPQDEQWPESGEIDWVESKVGGGKYSWFHHYPTSEDNQKQVGSSVSNDIQNWHNYAVEWRKNAIRGYLDGVKVWEYTDPAAQPPGPMHLCYQLDPSKAEGMVEAKLQCQWVRIYANPEGA